MTTTKRKSAPSAWDIAQHWATHRPGWVIDLNEPACFACGWYREGCDRVKSIKSRWEKAGLERAHIIARSSRGSFEPENFALLCEECHSRAPMTEFSEIMVQWINARQPSPLARRALEAIELAKASGVTELPEVSKGQLARVAKALGVGTHKTKITSGSIAAILTVIHAARPEGA